MRRGVLENRTLQGLVNYPRDSAVLVICCSISHIYQPKFNPWGAYLVGSLEDNDQDPVHLDPAQAEELSRMTAERTVGLFQERRY